MDTSPSIVEALLRTFEERADIEALRTALAQLEAATGAPASKADALAARQSQWRLFLDGVNRIDAKLIPDFDFDDVPTLSSEPPPQTGLPAGVSPASIADPALRAQYERAIAENQAKAAVYNFQSRLKRTDEQWMDAFEAFVSARFPRAEAPALERAINEGVTLASRRTALKQRVRDAFN